MLTNRPPCKRMKRTDSTAKAAHRCSEHTKARVTAISKLIEIDVTKSPFSQLRFIPRAQMFEAKRSARSELSKIHVGCQQRLPAAVERSDGGGSSNATRCRDFETHKCELNESNMQLGTVHRYRRREMRVRQRPNSNLKPCGQVKIEKSDLVDAKF